MKKVLVLFALLLGALAFVNAQTVIDVTGEITSNTTWAKNNVYLLKGFVYVKNGATLTIQPGTTIKGDKGTKGTLIVTRGSKIIADGTANEPIVFTSNETVKNYGDWGGLIILGNASTNNVFQGQAGCGEIEGGVNNANGDGLYGGGCGGGTPNAADNSGILRYVRIEYPGIAFQQNNEINGLTMGGVGSGTTIDHVQVSYSGDDSFEWFGGSVNCKHLIAYRGFDDDFDCDFGYNGDVQYALAVRDPEQADVSGSNGFEIDNDAQGTATTPKTRPTFSNVTIVGPASVDQATTLYRRSAHLRRNSEPGIFNSILIGNYPVGIFIDGATTGTNAVNGLLEVKNVFVSGQVDPLNDNSNDLDVDAWFATSGWGNQIFANPADLKHVDPFNLDAPNAAPQFNAPAIGAAAFTSARLNKPFFDNVGYAGAFDGTNDWTCGWAKFLDLNDDCLITDTKDAERYIAGVKLMPTVTSNSTLVSFNLTEAADLQIDVFGLNGEFFGQQVNTRAFAGEQQYTIETRDLPAGFYFVRIQAGAAVKTEKMIVVR